MAILDTARFRNEILEDLTEMKGRLATLDALFSLGTGSTNITNFRSKIVNFTPVVDTSAYAANDVLFDTITVSLSSNSSAGARGTILSAAILDRADTAAQTIRLFFLRSNVSLGTVNAAISITDDNAAEIIGTAAVTTNIDLINSRMGEAQSIVIPFELTGQNLYVAATTGGTPTFGNANDIRVCLSIQMESPV